jgi:hypothetical protein
MAEKNFKITGGLALGDYALTANGVSLLWDANALASQAYVDSAVSGVTVNTNAIATSLSSSTLFVDSGDNLNVNTNVIATKEYVDSVAQGLDVKESVKYATTSELVGTYSSGNNTLTMTTAGGTSVDGQGVNPNDRVLIKDQSATGQNGIYTVTTAGADDGRGTVTTTVFTRAADALALDAGAFTFVETGTTNAGKGFVYNGDVSGTWSQFSEAGSLTAGSNIYLNAGAINVNVNSLVGDLDGSGLYVTGNQLAINTNVVASALASSTLFVDTGDNLNVNVAAIVGDLDGSGLYVLNDQLAVNTNTIATRSYVDTATSGVTVNTNAVATALSSSTIYVDQGDNLNVNVNAFVGDLDGSGLYVDGVTLAVNTNVIATKSYVDSVAQGLDVKASVKAATTGNMFFVGYGGASPATFDGITFDTGDRLLVKNQTTTSENGIYVYGGDASGTFTRAADADTTADFNKGAFTFVESGTVNAGKGFVVTAAGTLGTDAITWAQFSEAGSLTAGSNIYLESNSINVNVNSLVGDLDGSGLYVSSNQLAVNVNAIVGDFDGSGLYVSSNQLAVNTNALAGTGLVSSSGTLALDQYAAGVRYDGTSAATSGRTVTTDTWWGFTASSNTYGTVGDLIAQGQAFTFDILMKDNDGNARKSTVSGFVDTSGNIEYTEYAIVDSATPLTAADVIVESVSAGTYNLRAKATFGGMNQISIVANAVILDY